MTLSGLTRCVRESTGCSTGEARSMVLGAVSELVVRREDLLAAATRIFAAGSKLPSEVLPAVRSAQDLVDAVDRVMRGEKV